MTDKELLHRIGRSAGGRAGYKQLVRELGLGGGRERRLLLERLARLTAAGELVKPDRDSWALPQRERGSSTWITGRLQVHRDGYGFVRPDAGGGEEDLFIPPDLMDQAMQGDQVLVEPLPPKGDGRRAGRILRVLERRNTSVVGIFHYARHGHLPRGERIAGNYVAPLDPRIASLVVIPPGAEIPEAAATADRVLGREARAQVQAAADEDLEGLVVEVAITDWPTATRPARGRVTEVLGERDAFGVDVEILIRKHHLPHVFPERVLQEARAVAVPPGEGMAFGDSQVSGARQGVPGRRDFRDLPIVTIDGETAKDFDDAVMVRELPGGGYELQVHIADVAHYVQPGTALDLEARLRGNSVYFPDRAIPMLPMELSTDVCSLRPDEERLVLSCILQLGPQAEVLSAEICEGVIRSARRMTYTEVHAILDGDAEMRDRYAPLVPEFERMLHVATLLNAQRERRGSIDFDLPEPVVQFDEEGRMRGIVRTERTWANRLIEEFMLAANEAVAGWLEQLGVPSIYRIHEKPDAKRVANFEEIAAHFGYSLGVGALPIRRVELKGDRRDRQRRGGGERRMREIAEDINITPQMYQALTARLAGKPEERILTYLMLRSLKQARYSEKNEGHFALAAPVYTHFTSPIRRYADLIVHRITKAALGAGVSGHFAANGAAAASSGRSPQRRQAMAPAFAAPIPEAELAAIAQEVSQTERRAADAERELIEWKKIRFMRDHLGDQFSGIVLNVTKYGLFVELDDLFVEGLVPLESLQQDRYRYAENSRQAIGAVSGHRISVGDAVSVILERIDAVENKLQFALVEESAAGRHSRGKTGATTGPRQHPSKKQRARQKKEKKRKRS